MEARCSASASFASRHASSAATICREPLSCMATNGLSAATGLRLVRTSSAMGATAAISGLALEKSSYCNRRGCSRCIHCANGELTSVRTNGCANVR